MRYVPSVSAVVFDEWHVASAETSRSMDGACMPIISCVLRTSFLPLRSHMGGE